jgi:hypothetical protein
MARRGYWRGVSGGIVRLFLCLAVPLAWANLAGGADEVSLEYKVKAAFLLNFTKFIEWPQSAFADPEAPFGMCVLGKDPFGQALDAVAEGETVQGHKLIVRRLTELPTAQNCQLLYIDASTPELGKILAGARPGVLTVGEGQAFVREGGMIGFVLDNHKVRFDINQAAGERCALKFSARLLTLARMVRR